MMCLASIRGIRARKAFELGTHGRGQTDLQQTRHGDVWSETDF
ncbi:hypothetical protein AKJ09_11443 [Labilithrix luteola]|uniref:Uncharacterized protein n=1 Tax=Labilithrix luteola TaxID=1391654 RepID=A0A0K1QH73_9BACT|nr:hypothetical protein AKJ09_11443 [Labilithrix luteola]